MISYYDKLYYITSYPDIISYHIILYRIISYHIISYYIVLYNIILYHIQSYHIISYSIISYHATAHTDPLDTMLYKITLNRTGHHLFQHFSDRKSVV